MFTDFGVQAFVFQTETLYWFSAHDVGLDNFFDVGFCHSAVPDCIRINYDVRAVFALIQAARLISADSAF